jgi:hypothetical protein
MVETKMSSVLIGVNDVPKKSYITTQAPDSHVYTYTKTYTSATYSWSGSLTAIDFTASPYSAYNVAGIVLRETGKKLYADANPGVDRYMVGVFIVDQDGNTVSGDLGQMFIDPNCSVFAQFNGQRPTYIPTAEDDNGNGLDLGNPVYTRGNITTVEGSVVVSSAPGATGSVLVGPSASAGGFNNVIAVNATATANNQIVTAGNFYAPSTTNGTGSLILGGGSIGASVNNAIAIGAAATDDNQIITAGGIVAAKPIRCSTVTTIAGTSGAIDVAAAIVNAQVIIINVNGATTRTITNSANAVPGQVIYFIIYGDNASSAVDFNSGFFSQNAGQFTVGANRVTMSFVSDGTNFFELSRSSALSV